MRFSVCTLLYDNIGAAGSIIQNTPNTSAQWEDSNKTEVIT